MLSLINKTAIVTGAASGIGKGIATLFAAQGATVHGWDIGISEQSLPYELHRVDVSRSSEVEAAMQQIGRVDILVNSAGVSHIGKLDTTSEADMDRLFAINVKGTYLSMKAALPYLLKTGRGVILNICSVAASIGIPDRFAYSMSKGAVLSMTLSVARDYVQQGLRCNSISPGRVHTPFVDDFLRKNYPGQEAGMFEKLSATQPIGRMGKPEEIAQLALYLCSDEAGFITGADFPIDGGFLHLKM